MNIFFHTTYLFVYNTVDVTILSDWEFHNDVGLIMLVF